MSARKAAVLFFLALAGVAALYLVIACAQVSAVPLLDPDEPRYAACGRTMARGGSLLVPEFNGQPRINKPPLFYWLVALSDKLAGEATETSARAPSIVMGLAMLLATVFLGRRVFGTRTGVLAGLILASTPLFIGLSRACITDMTLSACMTATLALLMLAMLDLTPPRRTTWLAALCFGLALLAKATPAFAVLLVLLVERALALPPEERPRAARLLPWLFLAACILSGVALHVAGTKADTVLKAASLVCVAAVLVLVILMAVRAPRGALAAMPWGWGLAAAVAMCLWWYGALIVKLGWQEFFGLVSYETVGRVTGEMHREPMYYYLFHILALAFPWSVGLLGAVGTAWRATQNSHPARQDELPTETAETGSGRPGTWRAADRFLLAWLIGIVLFFSIPSAKLATYILPAMPALALLTARLLVRMADGKRAPGQLWRKLTLLPGVIVPVALVVTSHNLAVLPTDFQSFTATLPIPFQTLILQFALAVAGSWLLVHLGRPCAGTVILSLSVVVLTLVLLPAANKHYLMRRSTKPLCLRVTPLIADCQRVASVGAEVESLSYYLDRTVAECRRRHVVQRRAGSRTHFDHTLPPVTEDESYDAVVREEMAAPEKVLLFVHKRYYTRMLDINNAEFDAMTREDIARTAPPYARFVDAYNDLVVIHNRP
ncbi:MAG: glycosyltransferase family 39 protein [Planctomycetota bacterium]|nr:glycosyltransferase family 39 protein [Planctomycetota bacterium]